VAQILNGFRPSADGVAISSKTSAICDFVIPLNRYQRIVMANEPVKLVECPRDAWQGLPQQSLKLKVEYLRSLIPPASSTLTR
jgi:hypothetical protein